MAGVIFYFCAFSSDPFYIGVRSASAEEISADLVKITTPTYKPDMSEFNPPLGTYTYTVGWEGIPAATATISVDKSDGNYRVIATAKTARAIDLFYKLRYRAEGLLSGTDLQPIRSVIDEQENSKIKNAQITFFEDGHIEAVRATKGRPAVVMNFSPDNFTLEPFSAAFIARGIDWNVGDTNI